jgi:hypothetical protein
MQKILLGIDSGAYGRRVAAGTCARADG